MLLPLYLCQYDDRGVLAEDNECPALKVARLMIQVKGVLVLRPTVQQSLNRCTTQWNPGRTWGSCGRGKSLDVT